MSQPDLEAPEDEMPLDAAEELELAAFVGLLREATPDAAALAPARETVLALTQGGAAVAAGGSLLTVITGALAAFTVVLAIGLSLWASPEPRMLSADLAPGARHPSVATEVLPPPPLPPSIASPTATTPAGTAAPARTPDEGSPAALTTPRRARSRDERRGATALNAPRRTPVRAPVEAPAQVEHAPPSPAVAPVERANGLIRQAESHYAFERYGAAAALLASEDAMASLTPSERASAELTLAKSLLHLGLPYAALAALRPIAERPGHAAHASALPWMARIAVRIDDGDAVSRSLSSVSDAELARLEHPATAHLHARLLYLVGRARYEAGELRGATSALGRVPAGARWGAEAGLVEATAWARLGRPARAEAAARRALRSLETRPPDAASQALQDLARLSIARVRYARGVERRSARDLRVAEGAWASFELSDRNGPDAFLEEAWALRASGHPERALGRAIALEHTARGRRRPEALVLGATIQAEHCQWDAASAAIARFHAGADPELAALRATERLARTDRDALRLLRALRAGNDRAPRAARARARHAVSDRGLGRALRTLTRTREEAARAELLELDRSVLDLARRLLTRERAGQERALASRTRRRLAAARRDLESRMLEMDAVEVEVLGGRQRELGARSPRPMSPPAGEAAWAIGAGQRWPYRGELWPDEARDLVRPVRDRCGD